MDQRHMERESTLRILVTDDNKDAAHSLSMMLEMLGKKVRTALNGTDALALAESFRPHMILLDIGMPRLDGYEVARRIRKEAWGEDMILVAVTGWASEQDEKRARDAGFDHHMAKPVDLASLQSLMSDLEKPA